MLSVAGFGWMGWALREGKAVSTRHDRYEANGINGQGFHPFFSKKESYVMGWSFSPRSRHCSRRGSVPPDNP